MFPSLCLKTLLSLRKCLDFHSFIDLAYAYEAFTVFSALARQLGVLTHENNMPSTINKDFYIKILSQEQGKSTTEVMFTGKI